MSKGGPFARFTYGSAGASKANLKYITREKAAQDRIWTRNLPDHAAEGETRKEQVARLQEYARQQEENELTTKRTGSGQTRTHYRGIYSFDREVSDEQVQRMVNEHLQENFPNARCVGAIHHDTDHAHAHVWVEARQTNEKKINISDKEFHTLDDDWARMCAKEFDDPKLYEDHMSKKYQTQQWKREYGEAKQRGDKTPPKPERAADRRNQIEERRAMHARQYGADYDERGITRNQRRASSGEREIDRSVETSKRAERAVSSTTREVENEATRLRETAKQVAERSQREIDRDEERY